MVARKTAKNVSSGSSSARAVGVALERIESQLGAVLEAVTTSCHHLDVKIDGVEARLSEPISVLEGVVRQGSCDLRRVSGLELRLGVG